MKMKSSIELAMRLAGQETIAARFAEIGPEQVLLALLKFAELPTGQLDRLAPGAEAIAQLTTDVRSLRDGLKGRGIDSTYARRRLRAELGRGSSDGRPRLIHRSPEAKRAFEEAAKHAYEEHASMTPVHLLKALLAKPTPAMAKVLGSAVAERAGTAGATPLLDANGIDLTKMVAEDKLTLGPGKPAECNALCRLLAERRRPGILVIGEEELICEAMAAATRAISRGIVAPALKGIRIVDVTGVRPVKDDHQQAIEALGRMAAEAAKAGRIVLVLPPLPGSSARGGGDSWPNAIKSILADGKLTCLLPVSPEQYAAYIEQDHDWKRVAQPIWIGQAPGGQMPTEL